MVYSKKKVVFLCDRHGEIEQRFDVHIKNLKCPKCKTLNNNNKYTKDYINSLIIKYKKPYKYFLDKDIYNVKDKINIECKDGIFEQRLHNHLEVRQKKIKL